MFFCQQVSQKHIFSLIIPLTLFHVTPVANLFYVWGGVKETTPSNFVIFKDRDLKFGDIVH